MMVQATVAIGDDTKSTVTLYADSPAHMTEVMTWFLAQQFRKHRQSVHITSEVIDE